MTCREDFTRKGGKCLVFWLVLLLGQNLSLDLLRAETPSLAKVSPRRTNVVQAVGDRDVRKGTNGKVVELVLIPNEHSNGLLAVYLPTEKALYTADITVVNPTPVQLAVVKAAVETVNRLKLDFNAWIPAHPPNPDKPLTKADVLAAGGGSH